jgi:hypothetical protein
VAANMACGKCDEIGDDFAQQSPSVRAATRAGTSRCLHR